MKVCSAGKLLQTDTLLPTMEIRNDPKKTREVEDSLRVLSCNSAWVGLRAGGEGGRGRVFVSFPNAWLEASFLSSGNGFLASSLSPVLTRVPNAGDHLQYDILLIFVIK